jgi:hypothetical protein
MEVATGRRVKRFLLDPLENEEDPNQRQRQTSPQGRAHDSKPSQEYIGATQQRNEQPVAARRIEAKDAASRRAPRRVVLPDRHARETQENEGEECCRGPGPSHP